MRDKLTELEKSMEKKGKKKKSIEKKGNEKEKYGSHIVKYQLSQVASRCPQAVNTILGSNINKEREKVEKEIEVEEKKYSLVVKSIFFSLKKKAN